MTLTRKEWDEAQKRADAKRSAEHALLYRGLAQAGVGAKQVTTHPAWNWFLQILSALKEQAERGLAELDAKAHQSRDFSHAVLAETQASRLAWQARIQALHEVMDLPNQIIDDSKRAEQKLEELKRAESQEKERSAESS